MEFETATASKVKKPLITCFGCLLLLPSSAFADNGNLFNDSGWLLLLTAVSATLTLIFALLRYRSHIRSLKQLEQSQEQLSWALWGSGDGLWDWDISSGIVSRKGIPEMLGYSADEFKGTTAQLLQLMHPEDTDMVTREVERHLSGDSSHFEAEYRALSKDGTWRWILDKGKVVTRDAKGTPLRAAGTQTDITERKRAEEELRLAAEVIQSMNEVVVLTDPELNVRLVNHAFIRLMGLPEREVLNRPLHRFFSGRHGQPFYRDLMNKLKQEHYWRGELWQRTASEQEILTRLEIKQIEQFKNEHQYYVVIFSDITEQK
ncbi:MAG: PAS domain S-box protein, partial [Gammaproteobacteria bacterium]|nr:PAS domain S-box protein [Gammaproteobacteria bacterium]